MLLVAPDMRPQPHPEGGWMGAGIFQLIQSEWVATVASGLGVMTSRRIFKNNIDLVHGIDLSRIVLNGIVMAFRRVLTNLLTRILGVMILILIGLKLPIIPRMALGGTMAVTRESVLPRPEICGL